MEGIVLNVVEDWREEVGNPGDFQHSRLRSLDRNSKIGDVSLVPLEVAAVVKCSTPHAFSSVTRRNRQRDFGVQTGNNFGEPVLGTTAVAVGKMVVVVVAVEKQAWQPNLDGAWPEKVGKF